MKSAGGGGLPAGRRSRTVPGGPGQGIVDRVEETLFVERLDEKLVRPRAHRRDRLVDRAVGGDHDDMGVGLDRQELAHEVEPVAVGQHEVEEHDRRLQRLEGCKARGGIVGALHLVTGGAKHGFVDELQRRRVFDQQKRPAGHAASPRRARSWVTKWMSRSSCTSASRPSCEKSPLSRRCAAELSVCASA